MNSDIRLSVTFPTHPKTIMLIERLGLEAAWALIRLWVFASQHRPDGVLRGMSPEAIRIACGYAGRIDELLSVLKDTATRFLDADDPVTGSLVLHDWHDHNPYAAGSEDRSEKSRFSRMAKTHREVYRRLKAQGISSISADEYRRLTAGERIVKQGVGHSLSTSPSPSPSPFPVPFPVPKPIKESSSDALRLSGLLAEMILKNNPGHRDLSSGKRKECIHRWASDIDKLIRVDRKLPDEIELVIRFAQSDTFWIPNIMSGKKLREKYETLKMQMTKSIKGNIGKISTVGIKPTPGKYDGIETRVQSGKGGSLNG